MFLTSEKNIPDRTQVECGSLLVFIDFSMLTSHVHDDSKYMGSASGIFIELNSLKTRIITRAGTDVCLKRLTFLCKTTRIPGSKN